MNKHFYSIAIICLLLVSACSGEYSYESENHSGKIPLKLKIDTPPLSLQFIASKVESEKLKIFLKASHMDGMPVFQEDYEYNWPTYIFDQDEVPYEVIGFGFVKSADYDFEVNEDELLMKLTVLPSSISDNIVLQLPLHIFPARFQSGFPFALKKNHLEKISVGEIVLTNISISDNKLNFTLIDKHPDKDRRHISYEFKIKDEEFINPVYTLTEPEGNEKIINLEFAENISLPAEIIIQRTNVSVSEWNYLFNIPAPSSR